MTFEESLFYGGNFDELIDIVNRHAVSMDQLVSLCKEAVPLIDKCTIDAAIIALINEKMRRRI